MQSFQSPKWLPSVLILTVIMAASVSNSGLAQDVSPKMYEGGAKIPNHLLYDFRNEAGEIVASGQFVELNGAVLRIKHSDHTFGTVKLSQICKDDYDWVKRQVALQKKQVIKSKQAKQIVGSIKNTQPRSIIKGCSQLRPLGRSASVVEDNIKALLITRDVRAKRACLNVYPKICELEMDSLLYLTQLINQNKHDVYDVIAERPKQFLEAVASMDYIGLAYLQHVANKCTLKTELDWLSTLNEPIKLKFVDGEQSSLRTAAINAIGNIKSEEAASALVDLSATVETPVNGKRNDKMIAALITSLGKIGINNSDVMAVIQRHEADFPKEAAKSLERIVGK